MSRRQKIVFTVVIVALAVGVAFCGFGWATAQQDLNLIRVELSSTQASLESKKQELSTTKERLSKVEDELQDTHDYSSAVEAELEATRASLSSTQTDALHLHNPTLEEAVKFLSEDKTNFNKYVGDEYVCSHFAREVNNHAESLGIRCAFVAIRFAEQGHAIIAFDTIDEGLIYFDAIYDCRVRPVIGEEFWQCAESKPGYYYYEKPSFDDTIKDILVIW